MKRQTPSDRRSDAVWEDAGRRIAARLDHTTSAVVVGRDGRATALAALGIAQSQAGRRRVAVADLIGECEPLQSLVTDDDVHGIVDSLAYGISLNRIARQVAGVPNLFILPSGSEPIQPDEVFRSPRWRRLSGGFQEVGALLLLAVTDDSAALPSLVANTDGAVLVGTDVVLGPEVKTLATVVPNRSAPPIITPDRALDAVPAAPGAARIITPQATAAVGSTPALSPGRVRPAARRWIPVVIAGGIVGLLSAVALSRSGRESVSTAAPTSRSQAGNGDDAVPLAIRNPEDSSRAVGWSVRVVTHNTEAGALLTVRETLAGIAGLTYSPTIVSGNARWYEVYAGAFATRNGADSLLNTLRADGAIEREHGEVAERPLPLAVRLAEGLSAQDARATRDRYLAQGIPAYALVQDDGSVTVYWGAFETEAHAALAVANLRSAPGEAELVYRTGRP